MPLCRRSVYGVAAAAGAGVGGKSVLGAGGSSHRDKIFVNMRVGLGLLHTAHSTLAGHKGVSKLIYLLSGSDYGATDIAHGVTRVALFVTSSVRLILGTCEAVVAHLGRLVI